MPEQTTAPIAAKPLTGSSPDDAVTVVEAQTVVESKETVLPNAVTPAPTAVPAVIAPAAAPLSAATVQTEADIKESARIGYSEIRTGEKSLQLGESGPEVMQLKKDLNAVAEVLRKQGHNVPGLTDEHLNSQNASFTEKTETAVKALQNWQKQQGLDSKVWESDSQYSNADGVVGLRTMRTIETILGRDTVLSKQDFTMRVNQIEAIVGTGSGYQAKSYDDAWEYVARGRGKKNEDLFEASGKLPSAAKSKGLGHFQTEFQVDVPFISQFNSMVPDAGKTACYRACRTMAAQVGVALPASTANRIQVAASEDRRGGIAEIDRSELQRGLQTIDSELASGRPVIIGTSHSSGRDYNRDGITDHFVLVTGKHKDPEGNVYYTAHDPSTKLSGKGSDQRFYVSEDGNLIKDGNARGFIADRRQEMAMIVPAALDRPYRG